MRVRHLLVMGLSGLLIAAWCPPAVEDDPAVRDPSDHLVVPGEDEPAASPPDHLVVAGATEPGWPADAAPRLEYLAYYPTDLRIHRGDVVFFRMDGFHTVTFDRVGQTEREGLLRRDEVEPTVIALDHERPSDPTCGTSAEAPACVLDDPGQFVNSGVNDLKLRVDLPEGAYSYYCTIHSGMQGTIEVVPDDEQVATPDEVEVDRRAAVVADTATANDILDDPPAMRPPESIGDHRRWFVQAGEVSHDQRVVVLQFFPSSLTIAPGDVVEFEVPAVGELLPGVEPVAEHHTVTFEPRAAHDNAPGLVHYLNPMCDPDDPEAGLPGAPLFPALLVGCPDGLTLELGMQPWAYRDPLRAPGDAVATEATVHDSGILVPPDNPCRTGCDPWTGDRLSSTLPASFPNEGQFVYRCQLHGPMRGAVTVSGE